MTNIEEVIVKQRKFFDSGVTRSMDFRKKSLIRLKNSILDHETEIERALKQDLNKSRFETYETEIGMVLEEIRYMLAHMKRLLKPKKVKTPLTQFHSASHIYHEPHGCVLIMAPWNYPLQLALTPLVGAVACGNCAVVKPSNYAAATAAIIGRIISAAFDPSYVALIEGGREVNQSLLDQKFDLIFFTGSPEVGKVVMEKAAKHLTPVILELGGKSPCIVDETADIELAGRRIAWGKTLNAGQTCVAPDYLLVHRSVKSQLLKEIEKSAIRFYGKNMAVNPEYPKIINGKHFARLKALIESGEAVFGGACNEETHQIGLTVLDRVAWDDPVMREEIFGPVLPVIEYEDLDEVLAVINSRAKPLALYLFTKSRKTERKVIGGVVYGGGCVNDTIVHLATPHMGFGGVGESGMGNYHGAASVSAFSHVKSVMKKSNFFDLPVRYAPYRDKHKTLKKFLK